MKSTNCESSQIPTVLSSNDLGAITGGGDLKKKILERAGEEDDSDLIQWLQEYDIVTNPYDSTPPDPRKEIEATTGSRR